MDADAFEDVYLFGADLSAVEVVEDLHDCVDVVDYCEVAGVDSVSFKWALVGSYGD